MKRIELTVLTVAALFTFVASASANATVPEGGATVGLLAITLIALVALRRKLSK